MAPGRAHRVLLVDDDPSLLRVTEKQLESSGYDVEAVPDAETALASFDEHGADLVLTDLQLPGRDGIELLAEVKRRDPSSAVVVITAHGTVQNAVEAMKAGAVDFLEKPFSKESLLLAVEKGLRFRALAAENVRLHLELEDRFSFERFVGASAAMERVYQTLARVSRTDVPVLIRGESGTGKELAARAIHYRGARAKKPFVAVNLAAIPENLIETELFGHVKGAFTGADRDRPGRFREADEGTLFLDEIGDVRPDFQVKLLRALQEGEVRPVGGSQTEKVDVRVITATNRDLEAALEEGAFREDLYYRIAVVVLTMPALRDRREDVPLLAAHFLEKSGAAGVRMEPDFLHALRAYHWPGNVRELENVVSRALVLRESEDRLTAADLPPAVVAPTPPSGPLSLAIPDEGISLAEVERTLIRKALEKTEGNRSQAARLLGITRQTLLYRMEKHRI